MKESNLIKKIKIWCKTNDFYIVKYHGNHYSEPGVPDLLACYEGVFIGMEAKVGYNKPTERQLFDLHAIKKAGGIALIITDKDWLHWLATIKDMIDKGELNGLRSLIRLPKRRLFPS